MTYRTINSLLLLCVLLRIPVTILRPAQHPRHDD